MDAQHTVLCKELLSIGSWDTSRQTARLGSFAKRLCFLAIIASCVLTSGCGSKTAATTEQENGESAPKASEDSLVLEPTEIVSQFLDRVRRGGDDSGASDLLTKLAQQEMTRIGRPLQFPGSPDTTFEVRQALPAPDRKDMVWVHTYLAEPTQTGETVQYEVVWTLSKEVAGWRISGFVIDQGEDLEPMEIDFENGDEMEARLASIEEPEATSDR